MPAPPTTFCWAAPTAGYDQLAKAFTGTNNYRRLDDYSYFQYVEGAQTFNFSSDQTNINWDQGTYAVYMGKFFHNRVTTVSGVRYDRADTLRVTRNAESVVTSNLRRPNNQATGETTPQVGVTYSVNSRLCVALRRP